MHIHLIRLYGKKKRLLKYIFNINYFSALEMSKLKMIPYLFDKTFYKYILVITKLIL
jgi:hypothetical protein